MKVSNHKLFCCFEYDSTTSTKFKLGDIVIKYPNELYDDMDDKPEIGVIIQIHSENEYRTEMFGNCSSSEIMLASQNEIDLYKPNVFTDYCKNNLLEQK
jgi:hypothetical protein